MTFTFTETELYQYTEIIMNLAYYRNSHETLPDYEEWLETTFGENWFDLHMDFDADLFAEVGEDNSGLLLESDEAQTDLTTSSSVS